ncbi:flagellar biosynthesis protein FlhB [Oceanospirillum linum]|uniref:Flagellar biosynthetic protein FlhB n=1 Tax=Oceanospirillum linum TaxID=966 RepID=A0A1T1HFD5_OCELI|nr:flagellar biosynthesis protein FlhB [Oceanospirillum linum]OOV88564.1 flagellar biosynthesis protein FlhB [Oceanospirillum linum]SEF61035.1 flagellar biosynthetic protein FlhB [Oleiphilus messinensis]SMP07086.1 flagellar biosynthetic protein FlhB [Oceanospirillum linum]
MAKENEDGQEKTEDPTPKRIQEAREKGDVPRSKDLNTMLLTLVAAAALLTLGPIIAEALKDVFRYNFSIDRVDLFDTQGMFRHLTHSAKESLMGMLPTMAVLVLATLIAPISLGGWNFSTKALAPKFSRLNPIEGIKRLFSLNSLVELFKSIAKVSVVGVSAVLVFLAYRMELPYLAWMAPEYAFGRMVEILAWVAIWVSSSLILIVLIDVPFQLHQYNEKMRMTLQEVKDEMKNTEGKPEVKGRIRQLQREMANRRMMSDVPQADVIITNPTHYAVALKYDDAGEIGAPELLAKGGDELAMKIREIAEANDIPVLQIPPLSRAIYYSTEIGDVIPEGLYMAVAQVLAYVYQLKQSKSGKAGHPGKAPSPEIPSEYKK